MIEHPARKQLLLYHDGLHWVIETPDGETYPLPPACDWSSLSVLVGYIPQADTRLQDVTTASGNLYCEILNVDGTPVMYSPKLQPTGTDSDL